MYLSTAKHFDWLETQVTVDLIKTDRGSEEVDLWKPQNRNPHKYLMSHMRSELRPLQILLLPTPLHLAQSESEELNKRNTEVVWTHWTWLILMSPSMNFPNLLNLTTKTLIWCLPGTQTHSFTYLLMTRHNSHDYKVQIKNTTNHKFRM